jgi:hypothetical protein
MKKIAAIVSTILVAGTFALPAAPVSAQSFSFGFDLDGPRRMSWCDRHPWECRNRFRNRSRLSIDFGPIDLDIRGPRLRGHVARCEARYRSYVARIDSFKGLDGEWHRCRL